VQTYGETVTYNKQWFDLVEKWTSAPPLIAPGPAVAVTGMRGGASATAASRPSASPLDGPTSTKARRKERSAETAAPESDHTESSIVSRPGMLSLLAEPSPSAA
jgi:hypothetical protein